MPAARPVPIDQTPIAHGALGTRSENVRRSNLETILRRLHLGGPATRSDLVAATGLTRSAVGTLVGELTEMAYVYEEQSTSGGSRGRPSPLVLPSPVNVVIAIEILVDEVAVAAFELGGELVELVRLDRAGRSLDRTVADLATTVAEIVDPLPDDTAVHGIGVAVAGVVRPTDNTVLVAPNLGWRDVPLADLIRRHLAFDLPVVVANEGDLGAIAVSRRGIAAGCANMVYVSGEVGVGGGIIADGRPIGGKRGFAGEIGHIPVNPSGLPCKCGSSGCWETEVGAEALLRRCGYRTSGGRAALDEAIDAADRGDERVLGAMLEHGRWLGFGLAGIINVFDPEVVVLGGMFARIHPFIAVALNGELDRRILGIRREGVDVLPSTLGISAPLLGAAEWAWEQVLEDPAGSTATQLRR